MGLAGGRWWGAGVGVGGGKVGWLGEVGRFWAGGGFWERGEARCFCLGEPFSAWFCRKKADHHLGIRRFDTYIGPDSGLGLDLEFGLGSG